MQFLDEECLRAHREYLKDLKLKYSILEKSVDGISGKGFSELSRMRFKRDLGEVILTSYARIRLHDIYFSSFSERKLASSSVVKKQYGSEAALLNEMFRLGRTLECGFVSLAVFSGRISLCASPDYKEHFNKGEPVLAIDLFEHAYIFDYGFAKEQYLKNALSHLNISLLDKILKTT